MPPFPNLWKSWRSNAGFAFYNNAQLDSFRTSIREDSIEAEALLNNVFKGTRFVFSVDREKNIFLSSNSRIITELPADFFSRDELLKTQGTPQSPPLSIRHQRKSYLKASKTKFLKLARSLKEVIEKLRWQVISRMQKQGSL